MCGSAWGGSEELWAGMAQHALREGIRVSVCLLRPRPDHQKWKTLASAGADLFCQPSHAWYLQAQRSARVAGVLHYRLGQFLRERISPLRPFFSTQPDVLLVSDGGSIPRTDVIDAIRKQFTSKPYVILSHNNFGEIPETPHRKQAASFYRGARSALFVSESNRRTTERQLLQKLSNARIVRNPVNLSSISPIEWPTDEIVRLASVARLKVAHKGQDILLEVLSDQRWQDRDWRLSIYGTGEDGTYLEALSNYYGLSHRVAFRGQTDDIRAVWQAHQALVLPSRVEGTPLALVEAMLCARPAIGTAIAGIPEWIRDGQNGFIADAPTVNSYATALETAWQRRAKWPEMGRNAARDALLLLDPSPADTLLSIVTEAAQADQKTCKSQMAVENGRLTQNPNTTTAIS